MNKHTVNIHEAKTHLSRLLDEVVAGGEVIISKAGTPIARLVPLEKKERALTFGALKGHLWIADDFDAALPAEVVAEFEGNA
jgi:prevent-host-death family protein